MKATTLLALVVCALAAAPRLLPATLPTSGSSGVPRRYQSYQPGRSRAVSGV